MRVCVDEEGPQALFELLGPNGERWRLYEDGSVEGFPQGTIVINRAIMRINSLISLAIKKESAPDLTTRLGLAEEMRRQVGVSKQVPHELNRSMDSEYLRQRQSVEPVESSSSAPAAPESDSVSLTQRVSKVVNLFLQRLALRLEFRVLQLQLRVLKIENTYLRAQGVYLGERYRDLQGRIRRIRG